MGPLCLDTRDIMTVHFVHHWPDRWRYFPWWTVNIWVHQMNGLDWWLDHLAVRRTSFSPQKHRSIPHYRCIVCIYQSANHSKLLIPLYPRKNILIQKPNIQSNQCQANSNQYQQTKIKDWKSETIWYLYHTQTAFHLYQQPESNPERNGCWNKSPFFSDCNPTVRSSQASIRSSSSVNLNHPLPEIPRKLSIQLKSFTHKMTDPNSSRISNSKSSPGCVNQHKRSGKPQNLKAEALRIYENERRRRNWYRFFRKRMNLWRKREWVVTV